MFFLLVMKLKQVLYCSDVKYVFGNGSAALALLSGAGLCPCVHLGFAVIGRPELGGGGEEVWQRAIAFCR